MRHRHHSRNPATAHGDPPKKILLIRWKSFGDVLFTLPAFHCVRANFPGSHITYMTSREYAPLIEGFSGVDEIFAIDRAALKRFGPGGWKELTNLWRGITRPRFDLVVDFQGYGETAWLSWLTRAPERWGHVYRPSRARAHTRTVMWPSELHPADAHLQFLSECGLNTAAPENIFTLPPAKHAAAQRLFLELGLNPHQPAVFIQPFTSTSDKDWPLDKWLALARRLSALKIQVLFGGGPADRARLEKAAREKFPVAAGVDLLTSCGLAAQCVLVLGSDTGLLHLAGAAGCRTLLLGHLGTKQYPYGHPDWLITPPRKGLPVAGIELDVVLAAIRHVIPESNLAAVA